MPKEIKLKVEMDLITIYQKGEWEQFIKQYEIYKKETKELINLLESFEEDYFIEYNLWPIINNKSYDLFKAKYIEVTGDNTNINSSEWNNRFNSWVEEYISLLLKENKRIDIELLGINYQPKTNIMSDTRIERLEVLANKWMRKNTHRESLFKTVYLDESRPLDSERLEFANKFLKKGLFNIKFDNTIEEAIDYGYPEVVQFIKNNIKKSGDFFSQYNLYKYLAKKLKRIRINANLNEKELLVKLKLFDESMDMKKIRSIVKRIERGTPEIDLDLLVRYSINFDIKLDDIIGHNKIMEKLVILAKNNEK